MDTEERLSINARQIALMKVKQFFTENPSKLSRAKKSRRKYKK